MWLYYVGFLELQCNKQLHYQCFSYESNSFVQILYQLRHTKTINWKLDSKNSIVIIQFLVVLVSVGFSNMFHVSVPSSSTANWNDDFMPSYGACAKSLIVTSRGDVIYIDQVLCRMSSFVLMNLPWLNKVVFKYICRCFYKCFLNKWASSYFHITDFNILFVL